MRDACVIRGLRLAPPLLCAPLAGITHSAFRRLVADFGGAGALYTEMLAAKQILHEDPRVSPYLRRRPQEGAVIYQLMVRDADRLDRVVERLAPCAPDALDINLGCHAPAIRTRGAGSCLFDDARALAVVLAAARRAWPGPLLAKIRLGHDRPDWQNALAERLRILADAGVDALILHPRFFEDKFKRRARHEWLGWAVEQTRLPVIANGDITGPETLAAAPDTFAPAAGFMLGRIAAVRPWVFAAWRGDALQIDPAEVWQRFSAYVEEDFPPDQALVRLKIFAKYFGRNFAFGHRFHMAVQNAPGLALARERAAQFFDRNPDLLPAPNLLGL